VLDKAIKGAPKPHQAGNLRFMHISDGAGQSAMFNLSPLLDATLLKPGVERIQIREAG
jgi:hypothetical protein